MPAPKGNRFAAKINKKSSPLSIRLSQDAMQILENMAADRKIRKAEVIESLILEKYSRKNAKNQDISD